MCLSCQEQTVGWLRGRSTCIWQHLGKEWTSHYWLKVLLCLSLMSTRKILLKKPLTFLESKSLDYWPMFRDHFLVWLFQAFWASLTEVKGQSHVPQIPTNSTCEILRLYSWDSGIILWASQIKKKKRHGIEKIDAAFWTSPNFLVVTPKPFSSNERRCGMANCWKAI